MHKRQFRFFLLLILVSILLSLSSTACNPAPLTNAELVSAYRSAIDDARIAEPDEICRNLEAIVYYNPDLIWEGQPGESRVLLLTWTSWDGYNDKVGDTTTAGIDTWTTVPQDLRDFYSENHGFTGDDLILRLEQLYGLPPDSGKQWFVEIWAQPGDVFRPSPDPEITDQEAELDFPAWVNDEYKAWFDKLQTESYSEDGYPWTRLGYTYDWGNPKNEIGLSEFIIKAGSTVKIHSVTGSLDYCKN